MTRSTLAWVGHGAWLTLVGTLASGPVSLGLVQATHPQPAWKGPATFAQNFHPLQTLPFFLGFLLVAGLVVLVAALRELSPPELRPRATAGLAFAASFAALVVLNYVVQTTFVPALLASHHESDESLAGALTMANPRSLGWAIEMWAYGIAGVSTWLVAPVFHGSPLERATRVTFVVNGVVSVVSALATALAPGWVLTPLGLLGYAVWNLLVVVMAALTLVVVRGRTRGAAGLEATA
jgi:hypothetical protein